MQDLIKSQIKSPKNYIRIFFFFLFFYNNVWQKDNIFKNNCYANIFDLY